MKPQKYAARRLTKENQTISTITSERDGGTGRHTGAGGGGGGGGGCGGNDSGRGGGGGGGNMTTNAVQQQAIYERDRLTQVKTYTDHGNGYGQRPGGTTHYSKVGIF